MGSQATYQLVDRDDDGKPVYTVGRCHKCGNEQADGTEFLGGIGWVVVCITMSPKP